MTTLTDFSPEDLAILNRTPTTVAMAAAYADHGGAFSLAKELRAGLTAAREAAFAFPDNEVIQLLAASMQEIEEADESGNGENEALAEDETEDIVEERSPSRSREASLELAAHSMAIMQATATLEEFVQFKHWLFAIADQVTLATKSGGFLGIGGTQVGEGERAYLEELREVLQMPDDDEATEE
ncbi:MAG: hypothetical protein AB7V46_10420 [Thermomicrobiales bacterium]